MIGETLGNRYRIESLQASGGFGDVYRAWHLGLDVPVALKVLRIDGLSPRQVQERSSLFIQEIRLVARLNHPGIVQIYDAGYLENGQPWFAMEWLQGASLREVLAKREGRPFMVQEAYQWLRPIIEAVAYAHGRGVVHRDLKPSNVYCVDDIDGKVIRVLDFGIGKLVDLSVSESALSGSVGMFSLPYAAPEQVSRGATGPWTDVHALGLLAVEMLTGKSPYGSTDPTETYRRVLSKHRPSVLAAGVSVGPWEKVVGKALSLEVGSRQRDAAVLLGELDATFNGALQAERRNRRPAKLVRGLIGALVLGGGMTGLAIGGVYLSRYYGFLPQMVGERDDFEALRTRIAKRLDDGAWALYYSPVNFDSPSFRYEMRAVRHSVTHRMGNVAIVEARDRKSLDAFDQMPASCARRAMTIRSRGQAMHLRIVVNLYENQDENERILERLLRP